MPMSSAPHTRYIPAVPFRTALMEKTVKGDTAIGKTPEGELEAYFHEWFGIIDRMVGSASSSANAPEDPLLDEDEDVPEVDDPRSVMASVE